MPLDMDRAVDKRSQCTRTAFCKGGAAGFPGKDLIEVRALL